MNMKTKEKTHTVELTHDELGQIVMALFAFDLLNTREIEEWRERFWLEYEEDVLPLNWSEYYGLYHRFLDKYLGETD